MQLRLYTVRAADLATFRGGPGDAARLRRLAADRFGFGRVLKPTRQAKLGPLTRNPLPVDADEPLPTRADVEALLSGAEPASDRLPFAWSVVGAWLEASARARLSVAVTAADLDAWEHTAASLPSADRWSRLLRSPDPLGLSPLPGMRVGFAPPSALAQLVAVASHLGPSHDAPGPVREWLAALQPDPEDGLLAVLTADHGPGARTGAATSRTTR